VITIAITSFNRADIVGRAIRSALTFVAPIAGYMVVVDDGSTDSTYREISNKFNHELSAGILTCVRHEVNCGATAAKNTAFAHSPSGWILFLDSDDELLVEAAPAVADVLTAHAGEALVFFRCVDETDAFVGRRFDTAQRLDLRRYSADTSYGEALVAINKAVNPEPPFDADLYGYEGIGCARLIKRFGPALLSPVIARRYNRSRADRLSGLTGTLKRARHLARGHLRYISICGDEMRLATQLAFRIKALMYCSAGFLSAMLWSGNGRR